MLLIVTPRSDVFRAICPDEGSFAIFFAAFEVTFIATAIIPCLDTATLNAAQSEFTFINLIYICKVVFSMTLELSVDEFSLIVAAISPFEASSALLLALIKHSRVFSATAIFAPDFLAEPMLRVFFPLACVSHSLRCIKEGALSSSLVGRPISNVNITISLCHLSFALEQTVLKVALISSTIWVQLDSHAIFLV